MIYGTVLYIMLGMWCVGGVVLIVLCILCLCDFYRGERIDWCWCCCLEETGHNFRRWSCCNCFMLMEITHDVENASNSIFLNTKKTSECTICLEEVKSFPLKCGHVFHQECLKKWLNEKKTCPNCRIKIKE